MGEPLKLEVFDTAEMQDHPSLLMPEDIEELRLTAYERGYVAGYEDAEEQAGSREAADRARVVAALEGLGFGYHEARSLILRELEPLIEAMLGQLMPALMRSMLIPLIIETLMPLADARTAEPLTLRVPSGLRAACLTAFEGLVLPPLTIVEDATLRDGLAEIHGPEEHWAVDLSALIDRIGVAVQAEYFPQEKDANHG